MIDPRAITFGVIVDQALTFALPFVVPGIDLDMLAAAGATSTLVGGYVAGRVAATAEIVQGAAVGAVALAIGLLSGVASNPELPRWYLASVFLTVVPAGALGGLVSRKSRRKRKPFDARTGLD